MFYRCRLILQIERRIGRMNSYLKTTYGVYNQWLTVLIGRRNGSLASDLFLQVLNTGLNLLNRQA